MRRRAWVLSLLAAALLGGVLAAGPSASAASDGRVAGVRLLADGGDAVAIADNGQLALVDTSDGVELAHVASGDRTLVAPGGHGLAITDDATWLAWQDAAGIHVTERATGAVLDVAPPGSEFGGLEQFTPQVLFRSGGSWQLWDRRTGSTTTITDAPQAELTRLGVTVWVTPTEVVRRMQDGRTEVLTTGAGRELLAVTPSGDTVALREAGGRDLVVTPTATIELPGRFVGLPDNSRVAYLDANGQLVLRDLFGSNPYINVVSRDADGRPMGGVDQAIVDRNGWRAAYVVGDTLYASDWIEGLWEQVGPAGTPVGWASGDGRLLIERDGDALAWSSQPTLASHLVAGSPGVRLLAARSAGGFSDDGSGLVGTSPDGRWTVFLSQAEDLVPDDRNGRADLFVRDDESGVVRRVSGEASGPPLVMAGLSTDGTTVVWQSTGPGGRRTYVTDVVGGTSSPLDDVPANVMVAGVSEDGQRLLLSTPDTTWPVTGNHWDVYDRATGELTSIDVRPDGTRTHGTPSARLSADGSTVVFSTNDPVLVPEGESAVFRTRVGSSTLERLDGGPEWRPVFAVDRGGDRASIGTPDGGAIVGDGTRTMIVGAGMAFVGGDRYLSIKRFAADRRAELWRRDLTTGEEVLVSVDGAGQRLRDAQIASYSADGSVVAVGLQHPGTPNPLPSIVRRDIEGGTTTVVCCAQGSARRLEGLQLSADGSRVTFAAQQHRSFLGGFGTDVFDWKSGTGTSTTTTSTSTTTTSTTSTTSTTVPPTTTSTTVPPTTTTSTTVPPPPVVPQVSVLDTHGPEDAGRMTWALQLDRATTVPVTVRWWTFQDTSAPADRRAAPDKDFKPAAGSVTFAPGETAKAVSSLVFDDSFFERDEWFVVELFDPTGATIARPKATGTINDDESAAFWAIPRQEARLLPA